MPFSSTRAEQRATTLGTWSPVSARWSTRSLPKTRWVGLGFSPWRWTSHVLKLQCLVKAELKVAPPEKCCKLALFSEWRELLGVPPLEGDHGQRVAKWSPSSLAIPPHPPSLPPLIVRVASPLLPPAWHPIQYWPKFNCEKAVAAGAAGTEQYLLLFCGSKFASSGNTACVTPHRYQQSRVSHERLLVAHVSLFANPVLMYNVLSTGLDVMSSKPCVPDRPLRNKHDVSGSLATLCCHLHSWEHQLLWSSCKGPPRAPRIELGGLSHRWLSQHCRPPPGSATAAATVALTRLFLRKEGPGWEVWAARNLLMFASGQSV